MGSERYGIVMHSDNRLKKILASLSAHGEVVVTHRCVAWKYQASMLSAIGSFKTGGRYNPPGTFEALYLADTPSTALLEVKKDQTGHID